MKKFLFFSLLAILMIGCNKNQKVVKKIDGTWKVTKYNETYDGITENALDPEDGVIEFVFDNCKLKEDEFCIVKWIQTYPDGEVDIEVMEYRVEANGTSLEFRYFEDPSSIMFSEITELTKDKMVFFTDYGNGESDELSFEKVK